MWLFGAKIICRREYLIPHLSMPAIMSVQLENIQFFAVLVHFQSSRVQNEGCKSFYLKVS